MNTKQSGVLLEIPKADAYILGGETPVQALDLVPNGDWRIYQPTNERQFTPTFDTMSCTTFSALNNIEAILYAYMQLGKLPQKHVDYLKNNGYLDEYGKPNFSDTFIAIKSGTTKNGNYFTKVGDTIRLVGLLPEKDLPLTGSTWEEYADPKKITKAMEDKAKKFNDYFDIYYEWVFFNQDDRFDQNEQEAMAKALKLSPVQIGIPVPAHHATTCLYQDEDSYVVFDQYDPFIFDTDKKNAMHFALRFTVTPKVPLEISYPITPFTKTLKYGSTGQEVTNLQKVLVLEGHLDAKWITGQFYTRTQNAVKLYQYAHGIPATGTVATLTRAQLNKNLPTGANYKTSQGGIDLIAQFEGVHDGNKATPILEPQQDPVGNWTLGYGSIYDKNGDRVTKNTPAITVAEAKALLARDIGIAENAVEKYITVPLTQSQFDALVSFTFNVGSGNLQKLAPTINAGKLTRAEFIQWSKAKNAQGVYITLPGLVTRRNKEADLYGLPQLKEEPKKDMQEIIKTFDGKKTYIGIAVMAITALLQYAGYKDIIATSDLEQLVINIANVAGTLLALYGRYKASKKAE